MYQSVMAQRQGPGNSGVGFYYAVVKVMEVHPDKDMCLVQDLNTSNQQDLAISKRGETAWPQVGDMWLMDRSAGHWMLQCKITESSAPAFTGTYSTMDPDLFRLASLLKGLGLITDATTSGTVPVVTGSRATITPTVQSILAILDARGILDDQTTVASPAPDVWQTPTLFTGWTPYSTAAAPRYKLNYDNTVSIEGRAVPPASVTAGVTLFTLPVGYRPPVPKNAPSSTGAGGCGNLIINPDGTVRLWDFGATTPTVTTFQLRYSLLP